MYIVSFEDEGSAAGQRQTHMQDHLNFLTRNGDRILSAGPLSDPYSGLPAGGLWVVDCQDVDSVWQLVRNDPFWATGLRKSVTVQRWNRVFANDAVVRPAH